MKNHLGAIVSVTAIIAAGFVYNTTLPTNNLQGELGEMMMSSEMSSLSSSSSSQDFEQYCSDVCGAKGLCCDQLIGGGFPTCKQCDTCNAVDDLNAGFCCSAEGAANNQDACCAYNPNFCAKSSSSVSSSRSQTNNQISCPNKTNSKPAWGQSAVHTYTDASGQNGRANAYANAQADALTQANVACSSIQVGPCDMNCGTVSVNGPTFTPREQGIQCGEQLLNLGVHGVTCRIDGVCSIQRECSVKY